MDNFGKALGLLFSVVFFVFAAWFAMSGQLDEASQTTVTFFYVMVVFAGGPMLYYYVGQVASFDWKTPFAKLSVSGAYAVAIGAVFVIHYLPRNHVWRLIKFDNAAKDISPEGIRLVDQSASARVYEVRTYSANDPYQLVCHFDPDTKDIALKLKVQHAAGISPVSAVVSRRGKMQLDLPLDLNE